MADELKEQPKPPQKPPYTEVPTSCPHCKAKQVIHVVPRVGVAQLGSQTIRCVRCKKDIEVKALDQIVDGPFEG